MGFDIPTAVAGKSVTQTIIRQYPQCGVSDRIIVVGISQKG
jgi:hypothetical protein